MVTAAVSGRGPSTQSCGLGKSLMNPFHVVYVFIADDPYAFPVFQWVSERLSIFFFIITSELTTSTVI